MFSLFATGLLGQISDGLMCSSKCGDGDVAMPRDRLQPGLALN